MTTIVDSYTWYSSDASNSWAPFQWSNKSDQVYGAKVSSPWKLNDPNEGYEEKSKGSLPARRGAPDSLEWEYEFGKDTIAFTLGGNDSSSPTDGEGIVRDVIKGEFDYKNGKISGTVNEFISAAWDNNDDGDEEIVMLWTANKPLKFTGLNQLGMLTGRVFQGLAIPGKNFNLSGNYKTQNISFAPDFEDDLRADRSALLAGDYEKQLDINWWKTPFSTDIVSSRTTETTGEESGESQIITRPQQYNKKSADKITNFNPSTDTLEIDTDSFGIDSSATFASGENKKDVKKVLAKQDIDFLYDEKKGGLYFNENGADKGFGEGGIIAILKGAPELTADHLNFI